MKNHILLNDELNINSYFSTQIDKHNELINTISTKDYSHHLDDLEDSNILEVLEFIEEVIRPKAKESKVFAIKKDLLALCDILIDEYKRVIGVYTELQEILETSKETFHKEFEGLNEEISRSIELIKVQVDDKIQEHAHQIYANIKPLSLELLKEKKTLLSSSVIKESYQSYLLDISTLKSVETKELAHTLHTLTQNTLSSLQSYHKSLESSALLWQLKTQKIQKIREVASDIEYTNTKQFASSLYEHTLNDIALHVNNFESETKERIHKLSLTMRFELAFEKSIVQVHEDIDTMQKNFLKDPQNSVINSIDESEIVLLFKEHLDFNYLKRELDKQSSFLHSCTKTYLQNRDETLDEKIENTQKSAQVIEAKIERLSALKEEISKGSL